MRVSPQARTYRMHGGNTPKRKILYVFAPNRITNLKIYIGKYSFCPSKELALVGFAPPQGKFSSYVHVSILKNNAITNIIAYRRKTGSQIFGCKVFQSARLTHWVQATPLIYWPFDCHTHFTMLLEVPHTNPNIFSSYLDELKRMEGVHVIPSPPVALPLLSVYHYPFIPLPNLAWFSSTVVSLNFRVLQQVHWKVLYISMSTTFFKSFVLQIKSTNRYFWGDIPTSCCSQITWCSQNFPSCTAILNQC